SLAVFGHPPASIFELYTEVRQPNKLLKPRETLVRIFSRNKEVGAQPNKHFRCCSSDNRRHKKTHAIYCVF
ncbi:hypothetical protein JZ751_001064, partial [Albula glossodonta]